MDMTKNELAELTGLTYRQVFNINKKLVEEDLDKALFVQGENAKKCDLAFFVQRWVQYCVERESVTDDSDLNAIKAKHESVKMQKTQLEVERMRGELVDVRDVQRLWSGIANTVMQNMLHLPSKVAPQLCMMDNTEVIAGIIDTEVRKVLNDIADTPLPDYAAMAQEDDEEDGDEEV